MMKTVQSSYLHLFNILSNRVELLSRIVKSSFSIQFEFLSSTSQFDSTLFQKNFNSTQHFSSWVLDSNSSTRLNMISLHVHIEKISLIMLVEAVLLLENSASILISSLTFVFNHSHKHHYRMIMWSNSEWKLMLKWSAFTISICLCDHLIT